MKKLKAFSLLEVLIAAGIISVGILALISNFNKTNLFSYKTLNTLIQISETRNIVYHTKFLFSQNIFRFSGDKNFCWAKINPFDISEGDSSVCRDDTWIQSGYYIFSGKGLYPYSRIDFSNSGNLLKHCLEYSGNSFELCKDLNSNKFRKIFYQVHSYGVYWKDNDNGEKFLNCSNGVSVDQYGLDCGDDRVKVVYLCVETYTFSSMINPYKLCFFVANM